MFAGEEWGWAQVGEEEHRWGQRGTEGPHRSGHDQASPEPPTQVSGAQPTRVRNAEMNTTHCKTIRDLLFSFWNVHVHCTCICHFAEYRTTLCLHCL